MALKLKKVFKIKRTVIKIDRFIAFYYVLLGVIVGYIISELHSEETPIQCFFKYSSLLAILLSGIILFSLLLAMGLSSLMAHRLPYNSEEEYLYLTFFDLVFLLIWYSALATMPYAIFILWRHFLVRGAGLYFKTWLIGFIMCIFWSGYRKWFPFDKLR